MSKNLIIVVRIACDTTTGCFGNMELYAKEGKNMEETIFSVVEPYIDLWHHVYQDNYNNNNVEIAEKLLLRKKGVCGTIRTKSEISKSYVGSSKN
jgi:hypothetical protein